MKLAIFDLDNTLLGGDSDHAWGEFLIHAGLVDADEHRRRNDAFYQQYQQGGLDMHAYVEFAVRPIAGMAPEQCRRLQTEFLERFIQPMRLPQAEALVRRHREQGDHCLVMTATNRFITEPIVRLFGVHSLIATELEQLDGVFTGRVAGQPNFRQGKVSNLGQWLERHNARDDTTPLSLADSIAYSDSFNDLPLLREAAEAVAVDPDEKLRAEALERGWPVISLREGAA